MADKDPSTPPSISAETAMNRILQAERDAGQAIAVCERDAREIVQEAQQRANRIASRTDKRISRMQMRSTQRIAGDISAMERAEKATSQKQNHELDETGLSECIREIALLLSGGVRTEEDNGDAT